MCLLKSQVVYLKKKKNRCGLIDNQPESVFRVNRIKFSPVIN